MLPNAEYKKLKESNKLEGKIIEKVYKDDGCEYNTVEYGSGTENDDESCEDISPEIYKEIKQEGKRRKQKVKKITRNRKNGKETVYQRQKRK